MLKSKFFSCKEYFSFLFYRSSQHSTVKRQSTEDTVANIYQRESEVSNCENYSKIWRRQSFGLYFPNYYML